MNVSLLSGALPSAISAGDNHMLVLADNGAILGCGKNVNGQLGIGTTVTPQTTLVAMDLTELGGVLPSALAAGSEFTLVVNENGVIYGCGANGSGQLGIGSVVTPQTSLVVMSPGEMGSKIVLYKPISATA
jgi:alpha-tubulin suppressor-like RCC1 family protein